MRTLSLIFALLAASQAQARPSTGAWIIHDVVVDIYPCQKAFCGKIIWLRDPNRRAAQCGKEIIWGLLPDDDTHWSQGTILDPDNGKTYSLYATLEPDGTLNARMFSGMPLFGRTEILRRVDPHTLKGKC